MGLLELKNFDMSFGDKIIFKNSNFVVNNGDHMGIVGVNGAGKSTLLKIINGELLFDKGDFMLNSKAKLGSLDQQALIESDKSIFDYLRESFAKLYDANARLTKCYEDMATANEQQMLKLTTETENLMEILEQNQFYSLDSQIEKVADGLGITTFGMDTKVKLLSGGQRAKVRLAKLLLEKPDILLLDEPTNFLDTEHILWLQGYLNNFEGAFVVVSHDENFLENITNCICDIDNQTITSYNVNFLRYK